MAVDLPDVIDRYFRAVDDGDLEAFVACFADTATVADEERVHEGRAAIRAWRQRTMEAYSYSAEPVTVTPQAGDSYLVLARVSGDFPGSPIELRYRFTLRDELIGALAIRP
ncbi:MULTISPECIES: nuclear transport factor 2 family protein [unclassified Micromonospora]|uniref:nuclear transport factor 2 family protein n=1 Tax=unclassified Micromonospora TaxID=2617518 RepID=UPI000EF48FD2|nr:MULTISPECIES: nuclear transport factor 2 family protein [unclassified Micromonospora]RLP86739.1 nuclear transport factor 2 family protein [Micromonospora sp. BL4]RLP90069.1 nuclear transport factor 2 family protein [Micromonospora sp. CV4]